VRRIFAVILLGAMICLGCNSQQKQTDAQRTAPATPVSSGPKPPQWPPVPGSNPPIQPAGGSSAAAQPFAPSQSLVTGTPTSQSSAATLAGSIMDRLQRRPSSAIVQVVDLQEVNQSNQEPVRFEVSADTLGNFQIPGLKSGKAYQLTARVRDQEKYYTGTVVVSPPNLQVVITLLEQDNSGGSVVPVLGAPLVGATQPSAGNGASEAPAPPGGGSTDPGAILPSGSGTPTSTVRPERIARDLGMMPAAPTLAIPYARPTEAPSSAPSVPLSTAETPIPSCQLVGRKLENFALVDLDGNPWEFRKHKTGRLVLLDFWFSTCGPCLQAMPHLVELQRTYKSYGLEVVGIAYERGTMAERAAKVRSVRGRYRLNYTTILGQIGDGECPVQTQFQVTSFPTLVLVDENGNILWRTPAGQGLSRPMLADLEMEIRRGLGIR